jgi:hypothetical protein
LCKARKCFFGTYILEELSAIMGSQVKEDLALSFNEIEDLRLDHSKKYPLNEIVFMAIFGALLDILAQRQ